jgi:hypothetical protein
MPRRLTAEEALFAGNLAKKAKETAGLTNQEIADKARPSRDERTIRAVLKGQCLIRETVSQVCTALGVDLDAELSRAGLSNVIGSGSVATNLGGYSRRDHENLVGSYTTIRPAYADLSLLKCYRTIIDWNGGLACLQFTETDRFDAYGQSGQIYIQRSSAFMYLMTINKGWIRTILVSQLLHNASMMRGLILSQFEISGGNYAPVVAPIVYIREHPEEQHSYGEFGAADERYEKYTQLLRETLSKAYAKIALPIAGAVVELGSPR